jgi:hypothetical protein
MNASPWARAKISFRIRKGDANPGGEKARLLSRRVRRLHDYASSDVISVIGSVIDGGLGANLKSSLDFGRVVDQELEGDQILALLYVNGKGSISDGRNFTGNGPVLCGYLEQVAKRLGGSRVGRNRDTQACHKYGQNEQSNQR